MPNQQSGRDAYDRAHAASHATRKTIDDLNAETFTAATIATGDKHLLGRARYMANHGDTRIRQLLADHEAATGGEAA